MALEQIIIYLIKVSISITLFYGLHMLLLQKETFFGLRRIFFAVTLLFSILYPAITIEWSTTEGTQPTTFTYILSEIEILVSQDTASLASNGSTFSPFLAGVMVICFGAIFLLARLCIQLISFCAVLNKRKHTHQLDRIKIMELEDKTIPSFSFFHVIVLNSHAKTEKQKMDILKHEIAHVKQFHSIDVLLYELFTIFFWWNPFAWLIKSEMKLNLEYLADAYAIEDEESYTDYQYTLLQISSANTGVAFINNFNILHLKKRMIMMNKKRSPMLRIAKLLLILPMTTLLVYSNGKGSDSKELFDNEATVAIVDTVVTAQKLTESKKAGKVYERVDKMPTFPDGDMAMMRFINDNIRYPVDAQKEGNQGRVTVQFIVNPDGSISNETVLQGIHPLLDAEALRVVKLMPKWTPAKQNGEFVSVYFRIPITFRLGK